jgi:hypothetical protein
MCGVNKTQIFKRIKTLSKMAKDINKNKKESMNYIHCSLELCTCKGLRTWFNTPKGLWCGDCDKKIRDKDTIT